MAETLISLQNCAIVASGEPLLPPLSWQYQSGERWLVTGPNGGGKTAFARAIAGELECAPAPGGSYANAISGSTVLVSFEAAARLIEEERENDDSDFVEGGVDPGRSGRAYLAEALSAEEAAGYPGGAGLEGDEFVSLCGVGPVLDRGLKYLSTGEIRRLLLCRALLSRPGLLVLDEPYEGLDAASRQAMASFFDGMALRRERASEAGAPGGEAGTRILLLMDRYESVPSGVSHVLELSGGKISYSGPRSGYEALLSRRAEGERASASRNAEALKSSLEEARAQGDLELRGSIRTQAEVLVEMRNVTVQWDGRKVLDGLSWSLRRGEHWLIRGPNGSGKTSFLELITGDNPQVFCNEVSLFGSRRGSGETIWELKEKMGIVSYRLHLEYRSLGDLSLEEVLLSGIHDSIGLYESCGEEERFLARKWLSLAGFGGKEALRFQELSYGEQRALLIARAAIKCPPLLILDEPCHGLDDAHRSRVLALLQLIAESGSSTLLHVTHDPAEVLPCERHVLELRPGQSPMYALLER